MDKHHWSTVECWAAGIHLQGPERTLALKWLRDRRSGEPNATWYMVPHANAGMEVIHGSWQIDWTGFEPDSELASTASMM